MERGSGVGFALVGVAHLLWLPRFTDPLLEGLLVSLAVVGAALAAAQWRTLGLGLMLPSWANFGLTFTDIDQVVPIVVVIGLGLACWGSWSGQRAPIVGGLVLAALVQSFWLTYGTGSPFFLGNVLFSLGALVAALAVGLAPAPARPVPAPVAEPPVEATPETVK